MKLKKFLKNFCIDDGVNENVDILVFDKETLEEYKKEGVPNTFAAKVVATESAGNLYYGAPTAKIYTNFLESYNPDTMDVMRYLLDQRVRLICEPHSDNAVIGIIIEEIELKDMRYSHSHKSMEVSNGEGKVIHTSNSHFFKVTMSKGKARDIKERKKKALKAAKPSTKIKAKKIKIDNSSKPDGKSSETAK